MTESIDWKNVGLMQQRNLVKTNFSVVWANFWLIKEFAVNLFLSTKKFVHTQARISYIKYSFRSLFKSAFKRASCISSDWLKATFRELLVKEEVSEYGPCCSSLETSRRRPSIHSLTDSLAAHWTLRRFRRAHRTTMFSQNAEILHHKYEKFLIRLLW